MSKRQLSKYIKWLHHKYLGPQILVVWHLDLKPSRVQTHHLSNCGKIFPWKCPVCSLFLHELNKKLLRSIYFLFVFVFLCVGEEQVSADIHSHESNDYNILGVIASTHRPAQLQLSDSWQASILIYSSNDYQTSSNISVVTINITNYPAHQGNSVIIFAAFFTYTSLNVLHLWFKYNSVIIFAGFFYIYKSKCTTSVMTKMLSRTLLNLWTVSEPTAMI